MSSSYDSKVFDSMCTKLMWVCSVLYILVKLIELAWLRVVLDGASLLMEHVCSWNRAVLGRLFELIVTTASRLNANVVFTSWLGWYRTVRYRTGPKKSKKENNRYFQTLMISPDLMIRYHDIIVINDKLVHFIWSELAQLANHAMRSYVIVVLEGSFQRQKQNAPIHHEPRYETAQKKAQYTSQFTAHRHMPLQAHFFYKNLFQQILFPEKLLLLLSLCERLCK